MPEALADLRWIYDTIEIAAGNVTAIRYIERIEAYCQGLDYASELCGQGLRVVRFERRVTVTFTVESDQVVIFRVFYGGANWEDEL
ncbi:type II toxin-antitoxin system RelE/ParE family toxin [Mesorhizobium sp. M7A.F.Ca.ET.027.03.2.1]|uniref:type II toxin-antitoxin system RelE/ParE family toxin n=1 Tax=Mesorhizobium sp. M7A.F.Ca.ET.027.03.2.1 TaxID=2496656 RepID=UPI001FE0A60F|nr:type II toxin-antitoxin system RelE/ParE family toxin [Mesorhizobium sp. M7A.F.Ca.ET.027.03.2.1]